MNFTQPFVNSGTEVAIGEVSKISLIKCYQEFMKNKLIADAGSNLSSTFGLMVFSAFLLNICLLCESVSASVPHTMTTNTMTSKKIATVSGVIAFPSKTRLPSDAIAYITLIDVSPRQDSDQGIIARQTLKNPSSDTIAFKLDYDSAKICANCLYAIQVQIVAQGKVIYRNASAHPVITQGKPTIVNVLLKPV